MKRILVTNCFLFVASLGLASTTEKPAADCNPDRPMRQSLSAVSLAGVSTSVGNVEFFQAPHPDGGSQVIITYDLISSEPNCAVSIRVSDDGGTTFDIIPQTLSGDIGPNVTPGIGNQITWRISNDLPNTVLNQAVIRVLADDGICADCKYWSDPTTWGGAVPSVGQNVTVPHDWHLILDQDVDIGGLTIDGTLEFAREDLELEASWIMVHGELRVGTEDAPFTHQATFTLDDTNIENHALNMGMGTRGIMLMNGGVLNLHGTPPATPWTKVNEHVPAHGSGMEPTIPLAESVDWKAGNELIIAPTDFHTINQTAQLGITETLTLASDANNDTITVAQLPARARWGRLQYATTNGMSLTPPTPGSPEEIILPEGMDGTPLVLDQRAAIGNLTRNIVVQAPDDTVWQTSGFGVHIMVMGSGSRAHLDGVEIRRGGQRFRLGRYPFHWHNLSYAPPLEIGDATGQYIRNSVINVSQNRGIVVHGTNGVLVENNIIYNTRGHGVFTEDASERRNTFDRNLVLRVRNPQTQYALKLHELEEGSPGVQGGSSGFWISNPDNTLVNNIAADCEGMGFWLAFTDRTWGDSSGLDMSPRRIKLREFSHNTAHSNRYRGVLLDINETNQNGLVGFPIELQQYLPTDDYDGVGTEAAYENRVPFELTDLSLWKNGLNAIWDRASGPKNRRIVAADNCNKFFAGSGEQGLIERCLVIGDSLNNASPRPTQGDSVAPTAFATYHSAFSIQRNIVMNFPLTVGQLSGAFAEDDFYFRPVEKGTVRNSDNILINAHPGYKSRPNFAGLLSTWYHYPETQPMQYYQFQPFASWFTFAPAKWDPHGVAGPAGNYLVYNTPFLTYGQTVTPIAPDTNLTPANELGVATGSVSVPGPFYGFTAFSLHGRGWTLPQNQDFDDLMAIEVRRYDAADLSYVGTWEVAGICCSDVQLAHMRDFAAHRDGIYELDFPFNERHPGWNQAAIYRYPTNLRMEVENMLTSDDTLLIGIEFNGTIPANVILQPTGTADGGGNPSATTTLTPLGNFNDVRNSAGLTYWQDTTNNRVWVKLRGGTWVGNGSPYEPTSDQLIYQTTYLRIEPAP